MKRLMLLSTLLITTTAIAATIDAHVSAKAYSAAGLKNRPVYLVCDHRASVTNNSGVQQSFIVRYIICSDNKDCQIRQHEFKVGSNNWVETNQTRMVPTYHNPGNYRLVCTTTIDGVATSQDSANINIGDA